VVQVGADGRILRANAPACLLFGATAYPPPPGEIIGQTVLEATHIRGVSDLYLSARNSGAGGEAEVRLVGRQDRQVVARAVPVPSSAGGGVLLIFSDLTEIRRLQTVRTEFVANVSHELRTPLASIRATAETLLDGALSDPEYAGRFLETIIRESDRLVSLAEDLLALSRAETTEREVSAFNLMALLAEVGARLQERAERREVRLLLPAAPEALPIEADRGRLDQVLFNLIENAIKYTPAAGTVTVTVTIPEQGWVAVSVADTGIGILSQDLPRIFERFWRADRARTFQSGGPDGGGTGLGLAIVKHIVESHGGVVEAESELGQGSTFTIKIPLRQNDRTEPSISR
jgi:two-component system phosphate regulon sensor histidine kinase PhoR